MIAAILLAGARLAPGPQLPAEEAVAVELLLPSAPVLREEPFTVRVRLAVDREFLREQMLQPFRRALELPVRLDLPWLADGAEFLVRDSVGPAGGTPVLRLVLNGAIVAADAVREEEAGGRVRVVAEIERVLLARRPGSLLLAGPRASFSWTPGHQADPFGDPVPSERRDAASSAPDRTLEVRDWPAAGRPEGFGGAVGRFTLRVERAEGPDAAAGALALRILLAGEGNWETLTAPALDAVAGFHLLGRLESRSPGRVELRAEFLPDPGSAGDFPALEYGFLDPGPPPVYRVARSEPLALGAGPPAPPAPYQGPDPDLPPRHSLPMGTIVGILTGAIVVGAILGWARNARRSAPSGLPSDPAPAPPAGASPAVAADPAAAWTDFLAARSNLPPAALHDAGLADRLRARGLPSELAERSALLFEQLQAARYGGAPVPDAAERVRELIELWPPAPQSHP